ncbi:MAG TPA: hypothetical protein VIV11_39430 [Kofleriaceae bacterium]
MVVWRCLFVIASLCVSVETAQAAPSVAIDLSRLDSEAAADAAALEQALVMRLLQEGFAIDPLSAEPAIVVAVIGGDSELVLSAKSANFEKSRTIDITGTSGAQLQLEVVQKAVDLARLAREATPVAKTVALLEPRDDTAAVEQTVVIADRAPRWQIGAGVGVESTGTIEVSLHARFAITGGLGAALRVGAAQPDADEIAVGEQELLAGASYEWTLARALALDVSLLGGVRRHHFELAMPLGERSGTRFDPALALPVRIALRPSRRFEVALWGIAKVSREREHVNGTAVLWSRDAIAAGAGVGVAARF